MSPSTGFRHITCFCLFLIRKIPPPPQLLEQGTISTMSKHTLWVIVPMFWEFLYMKLCVYMFQHSVSLYSLSFLDNEDNLHC